MSHRVSLLGVVLGWFLVLCAFVSQDQELFQAPPHFPTPSYHFSDNPLTEAGIELGRQLFYEASLSRDGTVSCGSCHQQTAGFTQHSHALSHGIDDLLTERNSMPLQNLAWRTEFGWDGGVHDLDFFAVSPIQKPNEMGETLPNVLEKLRQMSEYRQQFSKAFGSEEITTERLLSVLSQFMVTLVSANSRYDKYVRNELALTETELKGLALFRQKCASCHAGALFSDESFRNNGLEIMDKSDVGREAISLNETDRYAFLVPSLRNVAVTLPYMHDGRFGTLEDVLEHYHSGVRNHPYTDASLRGGIQTSPEERQQLIAFLNTLTDEEFLRNPRFSETGEPYNEPSSDLSDWRNTDFGQLSPSIRTSLEHSLQYYLDVKNAMSINDGAKANRSAGRLYNVLKNIDKSAITPLQKSLFDYVWPELSFDVEHLAETESVGHQRDHISDVAKNLYILLRAFRATQNQLYYWHCPKANQGRGGYWLETSEAKIASPFFDKNSKCGQPKQTEKFN